MPMPLKLYFHPLASFCHKALVALYENGTPFEPVIVDLADEASSAAFRALWPMAKMPVLRDDARDRTVAESTIVVEYLDAYYLGRTRFVPVDPERAWQTRMWDRFYDFYIQEPMQKIVTDRLRPEGRQRSVWRGAGDGAAGRGLQGDRSGDGIESLGDRGRLHPGRLRGGSRALLREHGRPDR